MIHTRCPKCGAKSSRDGFYPRGQFCYCGWGKTTKPTDQSFRCLPIASRLRRWSVEMDRSAEEAANFCDKIAESNRLLAGALREAAEKIESSEKRTCGTCAKCSIQDGKEEAPTCQEGSSAHYSDFVDPDTDKCGHWEEKSDG